MTGAYCYRTGVYGNDKNLKDAPEAKNLVTIPEYFSKHGYHSLSMGKIFHKHGTKVAGELDEGAWAFDEWHKSLPTAGPATKDKPDNGLPANPENDGRSFAKLLHNPEMEWNEPTLTTYQMGNHRIYDGRYSYIAYKGGEELYDHKADPLEWVNQARNPEFDPIKDRLKKYLPKTNEPPSSVNPFDGNKKPLKKK